MKVLYLTGMYPTPAFPQKGIFCHEQVKALLDLGVEVEVVVPVTVYDRDGTPAQWELEGVNIRYVRYFKFPGVRLFEKIGTFLYWALRCANIDFSQYDIIHADAPLPAGYAAMLLSEKYHIPYMVHGHGLDVFSEESYAGAPNCPKIMAESVKVYAQADAIVGVSQKVLDQIAKRVDVTEKGFVVYNGVDTEKFFPVEKTPTDKIVLTAIGNLIPLKGHDYTLRAIRQLVDSGYKNILLKLIGRGPLEQDLKDLVKELDIEEYVQFIGYIPYENVAKHLQESDIFVLPSWYEALGCVYLEAMACGVPAIGCWGNGIDEIIEDSKDGFLVENKSLKHLTAVLKQLMDEKLRVKVGRSAREKTTGGYTWLVSARALVFAYGYVLDKR